MKLNASERGVVVSDLSSCRDVHCDTTGADRMPWGDVEVELTDLDLQLGLGEPKDPWPRNPNPGDSCSRVSWH